MFSNYYGKYKDGKVLEYDQFMTIGKDKKWDFDKIDESSLRIFNPTNNDTIVVVNLYDLEEHFNNELVIDIDNCWDEMTEFVSASAFESIIYYYNNLK